MSKDIINSLDESTENFLDTISKFTQDNFNTVPFEGSWTAAQVVEHILKSEKGLPKLLSGNTKPTERNPDEKVEQINTIFLDYSTKMKSPDFNLPSNDILDKEKVYEMFKSKRSEIKDLSETLDLTLTYTGFAISGMGEFTGIEWLTFIIAHSKRHAHQLQNIYKKLNQIS